MIKEQLLQKQQAGRGSGEGPSPMLLSLKNKRYLACDEISEFDKDKTKELLGSGTITARGLNAPPETFPSQYNCIELFTNIPDCAEDRMRFKMDDGLARRLRACHFSNRLVPVDNEEQAEAFLAEQGDQSEKACKQYPIWSEKRRRLMALADELMSWMIEMHMAATRPGGAWPAEPLMVAGWTAGFVADGAKSNQLDGPMSKWYVRCSCKIMAGANDPDQPQSTELVDEHNKPCLHLVGMETLKARLSKKIVNGSRTLLDVVNGGSTNRKSHEGVIAALRTLKCFSSLPHSAAAAEPAAADGDDGQPSRCFHCQQIGHQARECPNLHLPRVAQRAVQPRAPPLTLVVEDRHTYSNRRSVVAGLIPVTPTPFETAEMNNNKAHERNRAPEEAGPSS